MNNLDSKYKYEYTDADKEIEKAFGYIEDPKDKCSSANIEMTSQLGNAPVLDTGCTNDDYDPFA